MRCGNMRKRQPGGRKFCAKRGAQVARSCPKCGATNEPGEDFCGECGAPLEASSSSAAARVAESSLMLLDDLRGETDNLVQLVEVDSFGK